jgi:2-dehydro-3-deoxygalactonokinase
LGLVELPHLWTPCTLDTLAVNITCVKDLKVFPPSIPVYFVRGIKNFYDPNKISIQDIRTLDLMRGEETQVAGLLNNKEIKLPTIVIILSSHTKLIPIDEEMRILGSITTLSGQLYEVISKGTLIKKSIRKEDNFNNTNYFNPDVFNIAYNEVINSGFLRGLMCVRLLDILVHANWFDRKLFIESLFAAEDMCAINQVRELMNLSSTNFILIGVKSRCSIYKYLLETKISPECNVSMITDEAEIDQLSIQGVLSLAKKASIF